jgi:hypothetical protein
VRDGALNKAQIGGHRDDVSIKDTFAKKMAFWALED